MDGLEDCRPSAESRTSSEFEISKWDLVSERVDLRMKRILWIRGRQKKFVVTGYRVP